ncbi:flavin reductase family protein [Microlunatus sp. GCM10028923]|uniref:flavin reductase family protein n=1 Tax=Microlunatus sp. GCM10028923 TaxID=3273400 RepID=UPI00360B296E
MSAEPIPTTPGPGPRLADGTFRHLFRRHAAGVAVVTVGGSAPVGFTATSLSSLSAEPPLLSFNINRRSSSWPALRSAAAVAVHLLAHDQSALATTFATSGIDRFARVPGWRRNRAGLPILPDVLAWMTVEVRHLVDAGDHSLVVGEIVEAEVRDGRPLVYHDGQFARLAEDS